MTISTSVTGVEAESFASAVLKVKARLDTTTAIIVKETFSVFSFRIPQEPVPMNGLNFTMGHCASIIDMPLSML